MNFYFKLSSLVVSIALFMLAIPLIAFADGNHSSDPPTSVLVHLVWTGAPFGFGSQAGIDPAFFPEFFAQDLPPGTAEALNDAQRPIAFIPVFVTPSGPVGWHTIPSWYQVSGADRMIDPNQERFMAARAGSTTAEFPNASHLRGITVYSMQFPQLIQRA